MDEILLFRPLRLRLMPRGGGFMPIDGRRLPSLGGDVRTNVEPSSSLSSEATLEGRRWLAVVSDGRLGRTDAALVETLGNVLLRFPSPKSSGTRSSFCESRPP